MIAIALWKIAAGLFLGLQLTLLVWFAWSAWLFNWRRRRFLAEQDRNRSMENARGMAARLRPGWLP